MPSSTAMSLFAIPSAAIRTIRERSRRRTGVLRDDAHLSSFRLSSPDSAIGAATRIEQPRDPMREA